MSERLDYLVERLAALQTDRQLEHFDADVNRGITRWREEARTASALAPVRVASIGLSLAMGVTVGGVSAATAIAAPRHPAVLQMQAELAPSTLLEGG